MLCFSSIFSLSDGLYPLVHSRMIVFQKLDQRVRIHVYQLVAAQLFEGSDERFAVSVRDCFPVCLMLFPARSVVSEDGNGFADRGKYADIDGDDEVIVIGGDAKRIPYPGIYAEHKSRPVDDHRGQDKQQGNEGIGQIVQYILGSTPILMEAGFQKKKSLRKGVP